MHVDLHDIRHCSGLDANPSLTRRMFTRVGDEVYEDLCDLSRVGGAELARALKVELDVVGLGGCACEFKGRLNEGVDTDGMRLRFHPLVWDVGEGEVLCK